LKYGNGSESCGHLPLHQPDSQSKYLNFSHNELAYKQSINHV